MASSETIAIEECASVVHKKPMYIPLPDNRKFYTEILEGVSYENIFDRLIPSELNSSRSQFKHPLSLEVKNLDGSKNSHIFTKQIVAIGRLKYIITKEEEKKIISDLIFTDQDVSRIQCIIFFVKSKIMILDTWSLNGTQTKSKKTG